MLWYFETQPIGRILNRLSSDIDSIDGDLINAVDGLVLGASQILSSTVIIVVAAPWTSVALVPVYYLAARFQLLYRTYVVFLQYPVIRLIRAQSDARASPNDVPSQQPRLLNAYRIVTSSSDHHRLRSTVVLS